MLKCAHEKLRSLEGVMPVDDNEELMSLRQTNNVLKSEKVKSIPYISTLVL